MDNLFKTDGIRGLSQIELTPLLFHKLGIYLALNSNLPIGLGYDTRESSILYKIVNITNSSFILCRNQYFFCRKLAINKNIAQISFLSHNYTPLYFLFLIQ